MAFLFHNRLRYDRGGGRGVLVWRKLTDGEFIRRFLLHVPPDGFRKIRHFGFLDNVS
jgi:hypothetical protein